LLEKEGFRHAIRLKANPAWQREIAPLLERPVGRPSRQPKKFYASFRYRAGSWDQPRRVIGSGIQGSHWLAVFGGELDAAEPLPRWRELWPWISWPALAISLFGIHQSFARRTRIAGCSQKGAAR
jgi:hypothetical protein